MHNKTVFPTAIRLLLAAVSLVAAWAVQAAPLRAASGAAVPTVLRTTPSCSWDRPGHNPYMGDVVSAVDRYPDIPSDSRARLKERMAKRQYDDIVVIRREEITGHDRYDPSIRSMHFGESSVCNTVTRSGWSDGMEERGLVYCEGNECILVPTVCRNVSRISRLPQAVSPAALPPLALDGPFMFPPPGAGPAEAFSGITPDGGVGPLASLGAPGAGSTATGSGLDAGAPPMGFGPSLPGGNLTQPSSVSSGIPRSPGDAAPPDTTLPLVTAVPEPQAWALMLVGLATMTSWARRKSTLNRAANTL